MNTFETTTDTIDELQKVVDTLIEQGQRVDQSDYARALFRLAKVQLVSDYHNCIMPAYLANKRMKNREQLEQLARRAGIFWV